MKMVYVHITILGIILFFTGLSFRIYSQRGSPKSEPSTSNSTALRILADSPITPYTNQQPKPPDFGPGISAVWIVGGNFRLLHLSRPDPEGRLTPFGRIEEQYIRVRPTVDDDGVYASARTLIAEGMWSMRHYTLEPDARDGWDWTAHNLGPRVEGFDTMEWDSLPDGRYFRHPVNYSSPRDAAK